MPATITVTGTSGAGLTVSAVVFGNVISFTVDTVQNLLNMTLSNGTVIPAISIAAAATITATKSGNTYTLSIS